jgi:hypothetical protein
MRSIYLAAGALIGTLTFVGCGGEDGRAPNGDDPSTGGKGSGGKGSGGKGGDADPAGGEGGTANENGPVVKVTAPLAAKTPGDGVVSGQTVHVTCEVTKSADGAEVDPATVKVSLTDSADVVVEKAASPTSNDDEYEADLVIATAAAGKVAIRCTGTDRDGESNSQTISAFVDHGPQITIASPVPDSAHPIKGGLDFSFTVKAVPLADEDPGADVAEVKFSFDGKECIVGEDDCDVTEVSPGTFEGTLLLDDPNRFPGGATGAVGITASNSRKPSGTVSSKSYSLVIDGDGPVIVIESPVPQSRVGGKVKLVFTVNDKGAGVDEKSVNVTLYTSGPQQFFDPDKGWARNGDEFSYTFDTKLIEPFAPVQTTINVRASDDVGNPSASGQSLQLYLDNKPPRIDLDPRNIRAADASKNCSGSFDPVGPGAVSDLDGVLNKPALPKIGYFRVFVDEQTNSQVGQTQFYHSGTDQSQVRLFIQVDPEHSASKLLVNKNPEVDNTCDDIGGVDDVTNGPPFSALKPIDANHSVGILWNQNDGAIEPVDNACKLSDSAEPAHLCPTHNSDMWFVPFNVELKEPHVYVVGTPNPNDISCAGEELAFVTTDQPNGWVCAAARVVDRAGNVGISPPIRLCVDDGTGDTRPACRVSSSVPPSCTDGCTPPLRGGGMFVHKE